MNILAHVHILSDSISLKGNISDFGNPPTIIKIKNFEPLQLAKKKHYISSSQGSSPPPQFKVTKKTSRSNSRSSDSSTSSSVSLAKPQGRPFNESLNARFLYFDTIDEMISELLTSKVEMLTLITDFGSFKVDGFLTTNSMQLRVRVPETPQYQMQQIEFDKENDDDDEVPDIVPELCDTFGTDDLSFVKIIRNNKGKLVKFEVLSDLKNEDLDVNYIKKFITYPRYKAKMKIYLIRGRFDKNIWFYNDMRMLIWDLENVYLGDKKILINNNILTDI
ncbi:CYFA0S09e01222g1_1 [Cyberlindnera fabianii]|uniref:CYFA0S09e01222g1_1 n=1 Tax=Cyberlindnera fabianii TaxID=36022 RepID=A0A061AYK9_CYBFA|nr:CYFA0S09e01222g1_1 [Cyberlindnera fabianii]